jgi:hypothetical protein
VFSEAISNGPFAELPVGKSLYNAEVKPRYWFGLDDEKITKIQE